MQLFQQAEFSDRLNYGFYLNSKELTGEAVEVGTHLGEFADHFLSLWNGRILNCVDPWLGGYDDRDPASNGDRAADMTTAIKRLRRHYQRCNIWRCSSVEAATTFKDDRLCFVYVDGCHKQVSVAEDLRAWWPKVHPGGLLAGHDFLERGAAWGMEVQPAVVEFAKEVGCTIYLVIEPSGAAWSYHFVKPDR
jgi:hypothetical protein